MIAGSGKSFIDELGKATDFVKLLNNVFPGFDIRSVGGFLQLLFVEFGLILAGLAAATLVAVWASTRRPAASSSCWRRRCRASAGSSSGGVAILVGIVVVTVVAALGIAVGAVIAGGDIVQPVVGSLVLGLYAAALAGIGVAIGGLSSDELGGAGRGARHDRDLARRHPRPAFKLPDASTSWR